MKFNTALALGPTDVSAIKSWAKVMMIAESLISLKVLLRARDYPAVNVVGLTNACSDGRTRPRQGVGLDRAGRLQQRQLVVVVPAPCSRPSTSCGGRAG